MAGDFAQSAITQTIPSETRTRPILIILILLSPRLMPRGSHLQTRGQKGPAVAGFLITWIDLAKRI
jgi:hypothetical protein